MFPRLQKKLVLIYTLTTGLIMTLILSAMLLFYISSQKSRLKSDFQDQLFTLMSKLQTDESFSDSFLASLEQKNRLLIHIEENHVPFFFSGSYQSPTDRETLLKRAGILAEKEGIYSYSRPISSTLLQSSVFQIAGEQKDAYLGNVLVLKTSSGYKKLILLQDITEGRQKLLKNAGLYFLADCLGILLLFLSGRRFVRRSLKPLEETYAKQQEFTAAASHELRSPLMVIRTAVTSVSCTSFEDERLLAMIKKECDRGSRLIKNLLLLADTDRKSWSVKKREFEIDEMLLEILELYEPLCRAKGGSLLLWLPEKGLPKVTADPELCRQIITILLDNAIAYGLDDSPSALSGVCTAESPDGYTLSKSLRKRIILCAEASDPAYAPRSHGHSRTRSHVAVSVTDHGPGIPDEEKKLIFDRFYRSDKSRNKKEHFGLGLSIAASLAGLQEIELMVQDTPGGGSTFLMII